MSISVGTNAVETIKSFAPMLSGVFRESSRIVCFFAFSRTTLNSASPPKRIGRKSVVVLKPLQNGTEDRMFGHPAWNAFARLLPSSRLTSDKTYCRVVTWNSPVPQVLGDMRVEVKISCLSHR